MSMTDQRLEGMVSVLLRTGVLISGSIVFIGGALYLSRHAGEHVDYRAFHSAPREDRIIGLIFQGVFTLRARSIIQLGLLCLIATPVARVAVALVGFAMERDRTYVIVTAIVLAVLTFSLVTGAVGG